MSSEFAVLLYSDTVFLGGQIRYPTHIMVKRLIT